jgi:vacuolar iron transporter family protein
MRVIRPTLSDVSEGPAPPPPSSGRRPPAPARTESERPSRRSPGDRDRYRELWADELAGAALYRGLAEHADDRRRGVFLALADAEQRHAEHWARQLQAAGVTDLRPPRLPFRVRALCRMAQWFGIDTVLPIVLRAEAADADKYRQAPDAPATMAAQERRHGRMLAVLGRGGTGTAGERIVRSETRHRASSGGTIRASVFGANDGLVSNFSLIMGVAAGSSGRSVVLLAGVAGLAAGALSMASGEWVSVRTQRELYEHELAIERDELTTFPEEEQEELELIYQAKGVDAGEAKALVDQIMQRPDVALDTLAREELGFDPKDMASPWVAAGSSFASFAIGAFIPLLPFLLASGTAAGIAAASMSVTALFLIGATMSVFTGRGVLRSGLRMALLGSVVATVTFFIGKAVDAAV